MKKGDTVIVIAGKEKGKKGIVARVLRDQDKVVIEGLNLMKRHVKPTKTGEKGGLISLPAPIHISNVKLAEEKVKSVKKVVTKKATKKAE